MENEIKVGDIVASEGSGIKYQIWGEDDFWFRLKSIEVDPNLGIHSAIATPKKGFAEYTTPTNMPKESAPSNTLPQHKAVSANVRYSNTVFTENLNFAITKYLSYTNATIFSTRNFEIL